MKLLVYVLLSLSLLLQLLLLLLDNNVLPSLLLFVCVLLIIITSSSLSFSLSLINGDVPIVFDDDSIPLLLLLLLLVLLVGFALLTYLLPFCFPLHFPPCSLFVFVLPLLGNAEIFCITLSLISINLLFNLDVDIDGLLMKLSKFNSFNGDLN